MVPKPPKYFSPFQHDLFQPLLEYKLSYLIPGCPDQDYGYYEYDTTRETFNMYDDAVCGDFWPFSKMINATPSHKESTGYTVSTSMSAHFGVTVDTNFLLKNNSHDDDGSESIFEFIGDDLMFVYIDDFFVLNGAAAFYSKKASINFATGKVHSTNLSGMEGNSTGGPDSPVDYYLYDAFRWALMEKDGYTDGTVMTYVNGSKQTPLYWTPFEIKSQYSAGTSTVSIDGGTYTVYSLKSEYETIIRNELNKIFKQVTVNGATTWILKDNIAHNLKAFYAESHAVNSNIHMRFNIEPIFSLSYDGNGGSSTNYGNRYIINDVDKNERHTVLSNSTLQFVKDGYVFKYWNTKPDGSGTSYVPGNIFVVEKSTILYAIWERRGNIVYDGNGGSSTNYGSRYTDVNKVLDNYTVLSNNVINFSKPGYNFVRWNTSSDGSGTNYNAGSIVNIPNNTILYAIWNVDTTPHTLTVDPNGGYYNGSKNTTQYSLSINDSQSISIPSRPGFRFLSSSVIMHKGAREERI